VTSLARLTGDAIDLQRVAGVTARHVARVLGLRMETTDDPAERLAVA
jgi:hypothetical protein